MKFITKNRDRFDLHIPKTEVIVSSKFTNDENFDTYNQEKQIQFILKNTFYIVEYDLVYDNLYHISGIAKIVYKVYKLVFYFQLLKGDFPFKFLDNESAKYKFIRIHLTETEDLRRERDLPF